MIKNYFEKKYNPKELNIPNYIVIFMSCYVIWQMGIIWLDANNSIIEVANNINHNFGSTLAIICVTTSLIAILFLITKPKYAYIICKISSIISLLTTIIMLFSNKIELCLYILVASCSIMSISSLIIYFYTYNSNNLRKQILYEMLGVGIISLIFHNDIFKINFIFYTITSIILLSLFIIGLNKINNIEISSKKTIKKETNKTLYLGITLLIIICHIIITFGANIVINIKNGITFFYIGHLIGTLLFYILTKTKINKAYIPNIYISLFIVSLGVILISSINIYSAIILGISSSLYYALPYYCNLTYKNTLSKTIYIIYNFVGIFQVVMMDLLLSMTNNNLDAIVGTYAIISIIILGILFIISGDLTLKINKMINHESKEVLFIKLSDTEKKIAELMLKDYSNSEIAKTIFLSPNTIKFHVKNILTKLNVSNKKELIKLFE